MVMRVGLELMVPPPPPPTPMPTPPPTPPPVPPTLLPPLEPLLLLLVLPSEDDKNDDSTGGINFRGGIIIMALPEEADVEDAVVLAILVFCVNGIVDAGVGFRCFHSGWMGGG